MSRTLSALLITTGAVVLLTACGCSESDDTVILPNDTFPPCGGYVPGKVLAVFDAGASLVEADLVVRSFNLEYMYMLQGQALVEAEVGSGDLMNLRDQLLSSPLVSSVTPKYSGGREFLLTIFAVGVTLGEARAHISSYAELTITRSDRFPIYVLFEVPVGDEDDWVSRFLGEDLIVESWRDSYVCPAQ
jgi:hypothetical protein